MKNLKKPLAAIFILLMVLSLATITGCGDNEVERIVEVPLPREPLQDGVYLASAMGYSVTTPVTVETTIEDNGLKEIKVVNHGETSTTYPAIPENLIPRIIEHQSLGVDNVAGATMSSLAVKRAVANAITQAYGFEGDWYESPEKAGGVVELTTEYDVIVVGLGAAGVTAYLQAARDGASVFGMEVTNHVGGNTAGVIGFMDIREADEDLVIDNWVTGMKASDTPYEAVETRPIDDRSSANVQNWRGGAKKALVEWFVPQSRETTTWLINETNFYTTAPATRPSGQTFDPMLSTTGTPGSNLINTYTSNGGSGPAMAGLARMIEVGKNIAAAPGKPGNVVRYEMRGMELLMNNDGSVKGVVAVDNVTGTTYRIPGKTVILGTGGFIGDPSMLRHWFGRNQQAYSFTTSRGDGIKMATRDAEAGTYNIRMPGAVHAVHLREIPREPWHHPDNGRLLTTIGGTAANTTLDAQYKATLRTVMSRYQNLLIGLHDTFWTDKTELPETTRAGAGKRFTSESSNNHLRVGSPPFEVWKAGGYLAAIFSDDAFSIPLDSDGLPLNPLPAETTAGDGDARIAFPAVRRVLGPQYGMFFNHSQGAAFANPIGANLELVLRAGEANGLVIRGDNLADLVRQLPGEVTETTLRATIVDYNDIFFRQTKDDPFRAPGGPAQYNPDGATGKRRPISEEFTTSKYTAILGAGFWYGTVGGLDVDGQMRVLKGSATAGGGAPIPGLYAVGQESLGNLHYWGKEYSLLGGADQAWAFVSGREAGKQAAEFAK